MQAARVGRGRISETVRPKGRFPRSLLNAGFSV